ncbi:MAG: alpha/beta fold hydrolase [Nitrospinota bacterium]
MSKRGVTTTKNSTNGRSGSARRWLVRNVSRAMWAVAPSVTIKAAHRLFFSPASYPVNDEQKGLLETAETFEVKVRDKTVKGWIWGKGPIVLLVHGWGGRGIQLSGFIGSLVESGYSVVAYDNPAHGESGGSTTNFFEFVETINEVSSHLGGIHAVVAHSMGAGSAMNLGGNIAADIKFVLVAPIYDIRAEIGAMVEEIGLHTDIFETMIENVEEKFGYRLADVSPSSLATSMSARALIIHDSNDRVTSLSNSRALEKKWINATLAPTSGLGHNRILRDGSVIKRSIEFLKDQ